MTESQVEVCGANYMKVVARAWSDPVFKAKLLSDPVGVLTEARVELPGDKIVKVVENTADILHLILPADPAEVAITDADLEQITGRLESNCVVTPCVCSRLF